MITIAFVELGGDLINLSRVRTFELDGKRILLSYADDREDHDWYEFDSEEEAQTTYNHLINVLRFNGLLLTNAPNPSTNCY